MSIHAHLAQESFRPDEELASFLGSLNEEGGVVSFVGVARPSSRSGEPVDRLFLDHHPRLTQRSLEEIADKAIKRFEVMAIWVVHRCGDVLPGEPIVFAGAAGLHRRDAFLAADYIMDHLKTDAIFWKREESGDRAVWIEPTGEDRKDRARWSE